MSRPQLPAPLWHTKGPKVSQAARFLRLTPDADEASTLAAALKHEPVRWARADDVLRAAQCEPLPLADPAVQRIAHKARVHAPLRPVLLTTTRRGTTVADGIHKLSYAWHRDPRSAVAVIEASTPTDTGDKMGRKKLAKADEKLEKAVGSLADALTAATIEVQKMDASNSSPRGREVARQSLRKAQLGYLEHVNPRAAELWKQQHVGVDF